MKCFRAMTDSSSVFNWVKNIIGKDLKIYSPGLSEVLVRRRLKLIEDIINGYDLQLSIIKVV